jgi:DNA-binding LytR/AlgR family response regulator
VRVVTEEDSNLAFTMKAFESDLPKEKFVRVHNTSLILIK